ncbi:PAS domain-containing protein [Formivibrio citricus]|uniref:histidine kinase n=1 Tax=Formivibrio citricus TaxID=83765 RepID=A0A1I4W9E8_9NEIS|nr:PAS domain S-box protein [Formivibrio citricus]SFN10278.1 PAS domain-containing protein [Formivibrio citricus]
MSNNISSPDNWLHALVEQTLAGIYVIQNGHFRYVNQGFADIFGYASPSDIIDQVSIDQLIAPEDRQKVADNVRRREDGTVAEMRYTFVGLRRDGRRINIEVHGRNMAFNGAPAVIGMLLDVTERKLAEAASNEKLRALFELSPLGIALTDMQGRYVEFNEAFRRICGYSTEELLALDNWSLTPKRFESDEARQLESLQKSGRYGPYEKEYLRKDGTPVPIQLSGMLVTGGDGKKYIWSIVEDISARKLAEKKLIESESHLQTLIHAIPDLIWLKNPDGVYLACNQRFEHFFGAPEKGIVGKTDYDFVSKELADFFREHDRLAMAKGAPSVNEEWITFANDGHRELLETTKMPVLDSRGHLVGVLGIGHDITERQLAAQNQRIAAIAFESQQGMVITDANNVIIRVNQAFSRITGYSTEEAVGQTPSLLRSGHHSGDFYAAMWDSILTKGSWQGEICNRRKNGEIYPELLTITAVKNDSGQITHYVAALMDITERKRLESEMAQRIEELKLLNQKLEEAQSQLIQAEKMSAVGQLAAGIAHEINNPVGFVNSNLGTLREYALDMMRLIDAYHLVAETCQPNVPAVAHANTLSKEIDIDFVRQDVLSLLNESREGLERVKRIVADLKDFSRVGESKWQLADVHKCLDSTLNVVSNEIKYKAEVIKDYGPLPEIMCMPFQLNQVFMNLMVNAAHAIKERGTIWLRTRHDAGSQTVWVEVEDNGNGIPPENLQRIFEPFFTTKPVGAGTGLGLSVSYGIVQKHQGQIDVRSEPGQGTVFRVTLPVNPQLTEGSA